VVVSILDELINEGEMLQSGYRRRPC